MSDVKSIVDKLNANKSEIQVIRANIDRCNQAAGDFEKFDLAIAQLSAKRRQIVADAFIAGTDADIAAVDKQISDMRAKSSSVRDSNEAANAAKEKLQLQLGERLGAQEHLQDELRSALVADLHEKFKDAERELSSTMDALARPLNKMFAIARAIVQFDGKEGRMHIANRYRNHLKEKGLIKSSEKAIGGFACPEWLHGHLGMDEFYFLMDQLRKAGVPINDIQA